MKLYTLILIALFSLFSSQHQDKKEDIDIQVSTKNFESEQDNTQEQTQIKPKNQKTGEYFEHYANGNLKTEGWNNKDGKRDGVWYSYFENGLKWSEQSYKNGLKDGHSVVYHPNGKIYYEGTYKADEKVGTWRFYTEDGELDTEKKY